MLNLNRANLSIDPLNESVNARIEQASLLKHASDVPRDYLGASLIGETCLRKIQFEWMTSATFRHECARSLPAGTISKPRAVSN